MQRMASRDAVLVVTLIGAILPIEAKVMTENEKHLQEAEVYMRKFESEMEPERLREAYDALVDINLAQEHDPKDRVRIRSRSLSLWLFLIQTIDRFWDPNFDPNDVPETLVQPPATAGGIVYPPGADPAVIEDPKARAQYEQEITANRAKADRYRLQVELRRINERISEGCQIFVHRSYTSSSGDKTELRTNIEKIIKEPHRRASLLKTLVETQ